MDIPGDNIRSGTELLGLYRRFVRWAKIPRAWIARPMAFSFLASVFEGLSVTMLIPLINGIVQNDFSFVQELAIVGEITSRFPSYFRTGNRNLIVFLLALTFIFSIAKVVCQYFATISVSVLMRQFTNRLRKLVFQRYLSFGKLFFDKANVGYLQQILSTYVYQVAGTLENLQVALFAILTLCVYVVIMFNISWKLTLVVLTVFPVLHISLNRLISRIQEDSHGQANASSRFVRGIMNSLMAIPLVKAYSSEEQEMSRFQHTSDQLAELECTLDRRGCMLHPIQEIISLCYLMILVGILGVFIKLEGEWNVAGYTVFLVILRRSAAMFGVFNGVRRSLATVSGPVGHLAAIFEDEGKFFVADGKTFFPGLTQEIRCEELSYRYPDGVQAVEGVNCTFRRGTVTAIVGQTGAGKSTMLNLLMRFYEPPAGSIIVDGIDINEFSLKSWRSHIAIVSQDALLFNASLRENILYGLEREVTDEELQSVLQKARLADFASSLPLDMETIVGDRGVKLSGGEKQRVSIARAMLKQADILFLDEATSALDSKTERRIQEALDDLVQGKTTIVIAHRLSTIKNADSVLVMENGRISEQGPPTDLLDQKGRFFEYWEEQQF